MTDATPFDFSPEQRRYLEGLVAGMSAARAVAVGPAASEPTGPDAPHLLAMARTEAEGKKLVDQEKFKRDEHPLDAYQRLKSQAESGTFPKPQDDFRWRFHGLFYVAPNQNAFMCRLRMPNGILNHWQLAGLSMIATTHGGGYSHVTTRANLQIREIAAEKGPSLLEAIQDLGLTARGSGADNIRNVTGSPTAGIDPQELLDTRPYARHWHHHILNSRTLFGLPRKFNVAFDGGGAVAALEDTNDIGFQAVEIVDGAGVDPGIWFRLVLGGITGHMDFARPTGVYVKPEEATAVADAIIRVFITATAPTATRPASNMSSTPGALRNSCWPSKRGSARPSPRSPRTASSRARPSTGWPISACIPNRRTASTGSASSSPAAR